MKYSRCFSGNTPISKVTFGCGPLSGVDWGNFDINETMSAVSKAYEMGVNVFDTADVYGMGTSETLLSQALGSKRHDAVISTKFGVNWSKHASQDWAKTFYDCSPKRVIEALDASLRRLRVDSIPLYYVHWPDPNTPFSETAEALQRCQDAGKIQNIGLSNFPLSKIKEINQDFKIAAVQVQYSLVDRAIENIFLKTCEELGIAVFTYGPLAQGFLSGKYNKDSIFDVKDCRSRLSHFDEDGFQKYHLTIEKVREVSEKYGVSMSQVAIRWVIENSKVVSAISGIKSVAQMEDNVGSLNFDIQADEADFFNVRMED